MLHICGLSQPLKAHIIACHVVTALSQMPEGWGLGGWSEQACESAHGGFRAIRNRMSSGTCRLLRGIKEFNYYRMLPSSKKGKKIYLV